MPANDSLIGEGLQDSPYEELKKRFEAAEKYIWKLQNETLFDPTFLNLEMAKAELEAERTANQELRNKILLLESKYYRLETEFKELDAMYQGLCK